MHLIIDGTAHNMEVLTQPDSLKRWMIECATIAGLHVFGEPVCYNYPFPLPPEVREKISGYSLSAVVFLGESSITVHTYPEFESVFIDVFSCKDFKPPEFVLTWIKKTMQMEQCTAFLLQRGVNLNTGLPQETKLLNLRGEL